MCVRVCECVCVCESVCVCVCVCVREVTDWLSVFFKESVSLTSS